MQNIRRRYTHDRPFSISLRLIIMLIIKVTISSFVIFFFVSCLAPKWQGANWGLTALKVQNIYNIYFPLIVNRGDWLWRPANIKGANKDAEIYVDRRFTTLHNPLFCTHTLCMNYVTNTFLLVSSSFWSKQLLCFVQVQGQKTEQ